MPKKPMSQKDAAWILYKEFRAASRSKTALKRLRRACESFNLDEDVTRFVEYLADYRPTQGDEVYPMFRG